MLIGLIADSHDRSARLQAAVDHLAQRGAELLIHCGDITCPAAVRSCAGLPARFVFGNNDQDRPALRAAMATIGATCLEDGAAFELAGRRLAVTHGDDRKCVKRLLRGQPDYLFVGHSHCVVDRTESGTRIVNPGALHRAARWTFALLDLETDRLEILSSPKPG